MKITNENLDCAIVSFYMHNVCNFKCSYCLPHHYNGDQRWPEETKSYLKFIDKVLETNKHIYIETFGGEPTLWPKLNDFVEEIQSLDVYVEVTTNASRTLKYFDKFRSEKCFFLLSWHYESIDDDHFFNVAKLLSEKNVPIHIPILVVPQNYKRARKLFERFKESNLNVDVIPKFVRINIGSDEYFEYTTEQKDWITNNYILKRHPFQVNWEIPHHLHFDDKKIYWSELTNDGLHKFEDWTCTAGLSRFFIEPDGTILKCSKGWKLNKGIVGNIFGEYTMPTTPIRCNLKSCPCKMDALVEKWSIPSNVDTSLKTFLEQREMHS